MLNRSLTYGVGTTNCGGFYLGLGSNSAYKSLKLGLEYLYVLAVRFVY